MSRDAVPLSSRSLFVLIGATLLILVMASLSYFAFVRARNAEMTTRNSMHTLLLLQTVLGQMQNAETGQRGYLLTGNTKFLQPYDDALQEGDQNLKTLSLSLQDRPAEIKNLDALKQNISAKKGEMAFVLDLYGRGNTAQAIGAVKSGRGRKLMDNIRKVIKTIESSEREEFDRERVRAARLADETLGTILGGSALLFALVAGSTFALSRAALQREELLKELSRTGQNLAITLRSIGDALITTDAEGKVTMMNPVAQKLTGWKEEEAKGRAATEVFNIVNEASREVVISPITQALKTNQIVELANHTILISRTGEERFIDDSGAPIQDRDDGVQGAVLIFRDITAQKNDQKQLQDLTVRLRRAMAETHHRVKNNLQVVAGLVELQTGGRREGTVPVDTLYRVRQHVVTMAAIHDILTHETDTGGDLDTMEMKTILGQLAPLLQSLAKTQQITFRIEEMRLPLKMGTSLTVLINELVSNAQKHGEGDISVVLRKISEQQGQLSVTDNGTGFPENFKPETSANTGLQLIESLGRWDLKGEISYQNAPSGGAQVTLRFPLPSFPSPA